MQSFALYFLLALAAGGTLLWAVTWDTKTVEEFYGFAETAETEINFNYPIEIDEILVQPGASVKAGEVLMRVSRARDKETMSDEGFRIAELRAEESVTDAQLSNRIDRLNAEYERDRTALERERAEVAQEARYRSELLSVFDDERPEQDYRPLDEKLTQLDREMEQLDRSYNVQAQSYERDRKLARLPVSAQVTRLDAERDFDASQQNLSYEIKAPSDGVIGNINAKIAEHKSSFSPLVTFYEPRATQVKAYIHEDRILEAEVGDSVRVSALSNPDLEIAGMITGLGSRIVEIPPRLRRLVEFKTYGREVIVTIPAQNPFLQKEKVVLTFNEPGE